MIERQKNKRSSLFKLIPKNAYLVLVLSSAKNEHPVSWKLNVSKYYFIWQKNAHIFWCSFTSRSFQGKNLKSYSLKTYKDSTWSFLKKMKNPFQMVVNSLWYTIISLYGTEKQGIESRFGLFDLIKNYRQFAEHMGGINIT